MNRLIYINIIIILICIVCGHYIRNNIKEPFTSKATEIIEEEDHKKTYEIPFLDSQNIIGRYIITDLNTPIIFHTGGEIGQNKNIKFPSTLKNAAAGETIDNIVYRTFTSNNESNTIILFNKTHLVNIIYKNGNNKIINLVDLSKLKRKMKNISISYDYQNNKICIIWNENSQINYLILDNSINNNINIKNIKQNYTILDSYIYDTKIYILVKQNNKLKLYYDEFGYNMKKLTLYKFNEIIKKVDDEPALLYIIDKEHTIYIFNGKYYYMFDVNKESGQLNVKNNNTLSNNITSKDIVYIHNKSDNDILQYIYGEQN